jgi:hypothetical protein
MEDKITVGGLEIRHATDQEIQEIRRAIGSGCRPFRLQGGGLIFFRDKTGAFWGATEEATAGELVAIPPDLVDVPRETREGFRRLDFINEAAPFTPEDWDHLKPVRPYVVTDIGTTVTLEDLNADNAPFLLNYKPEDDGMDPIND